jgi:putative Mg2+ transporter-C (MgtC) family protein
MTLRMLAAVAAGGLIGFERNYHGRPAGFRTHTLVCAASAMLMLVTVYEAHWMPKTAAHVQIDPTRMAQGIMTGIGFYFPLVIAVVLTLGVLSAFRFIEARMPAQAYYHFAVHFDRGSSLSEDSLRELVEGHGFSIANLSYRLDREEQTRRYTMVIRSSDRASAGRLARTLEQTQAVVDFRIAPAGD